jgi:formylglycine-generating enzyme required for sulfatase activity
VGRAQLGRPGVWEWTSSPWRAYPLDAGHDAATAAGERVLRGGSFRLDRREISCSLRRLASSDLRAEDVGFRVAKSLR